MTAYRKLTQHASAAQHADLLSWASDVLGMYFDSIDPSFAERARAGFMNLRTGDDGSRTPLQRRTVPSPVEISALHELAILRRSVRSFKPDAIDRALIDDALAVARQAPSACNRQAFEFRVLDDPLLVDAVLTLAPGFDPSGPVPCVFAVVGRYRAYFRERDMHVIHVDGALAAMSLLFGLQAQGLASCCINWPSSAQLDHAVAKVLGLELDEKVVMLIAAGWAADEALVPYSQKVPLGRLRRYNTEKAE